MGRFHSLIVLPKVVWFTQTIGLLRRAMPRDGRMSVDERRKYLKLVAPRYAKAGGKRRSGLHVSLDRALAGGRRA